MNTPYPPKRPVRFFNTTGPCEPWCHYTLPPADRLIGAQLDRYVRDRLYWVLHAPRQTGKTTFLRSWARELNANGKVVACYVSLETCQGIPKRAEAMITMHKAVCKFACALGLPVPELPLDNPELLLSETMCKWSEQVAPKPLVVLFDEVDVLEGDVTISFLRQLRSGFAIRGVGTFPTSVALVGMRDLRDYITAAKDGITPNPGSPFNIKEDSVFISNFSKADVVALFAQRTEEIGQEIAAEALDYVYEQSWGQPWIVNNLFKRAVLKTPDSDSDETITLEPAVTGMPEPITLRKTITLAHVIEAREKMIQARETHLDALGMRLRDPKIRRIIESIMVGDSDPAINRSNPNMELAMDLGLVKWGQDTGFTISNPIYEEMLIRYLDSGYHDNVPPPSRWKWQKNDNTLDMDSLLKDFQDFWRANSEEWEIEPDYPEAFPHLLLMGTLRRLLNGGGRVDREAAAGRGSMDLRIEYKGEKFIIEIKLVRSRNNPDKVRKEGLEQIARYRDRAAPGAPAYLVIFDRRPETKQKSWDERISWEMDGDIAVLWC